MKIKISAESTVDLPKELLKKFDISTIPLYVRLAEKEFADGDIPCQNIFDYVKKTKNMPKTSAPNEQNYIDYFKNLLKNNDAVIHFSISSEISGSYQHALSASKQLQNVFVVDSRVLSTGIALLCLYAKKLAETDMKIEEILEKVKARIPSLCVSFILNELNYLYKGGRCNSLQYFGSNLLKIRPQILVQNGTMVSHKKFMGSIDAVFIKYVNSVLQEFNTPDLTNIFITYTTCKPETVEQIKQILTEKGFKNIYITNAGATITSYCGENCLGILFINDGK